MKLVGIDDERRVGIDQRQVRRRALGQRSGVETEDGRGRRRQRLQYMSQVRMSVVVQSERDR